MRILDTSGAYVTFAKSLPLKCLDPEVLNIKEVVNGPRMNLPLSVPFATPSVNS